MGFDSPGVPDFDLTISVKKLKKMKWRKNVIAFGVLPTNDVERIAQAQGFKRKGFGLVMPQLRLWGADGTNTTLEEEDEADEPYEEDEEEEADEPYEKDEEEEDEEEEE